MLGKSLPIAGVMLGLSVVLFLLILAVRPAAPAFTYSMFSQGHLEDGIGIIIVAPKGDRAWENTVIDTIAKLGDRFPVEVAFGETNSTEIHLAVEKLQIRGAERIIVVPLQLSSHSAKMHQMRYILGLRGDSDPLTETFHAMPAGVSFALANAVDANPIFASVIADRALELSRDPSKETLVLVDDGQVSSGDSALRHRDMEKLRRRVAAQTGFRRILFASLPVSSWPSRYPEKLRNLVGNAGDVIIVPLSLGDGDFASLIRVELGGLRYRLNSEPLLTHQKMLDWLRESIDRQLIRLNWDKLMGDDVEMTT